MKRIIAVVDLSEPSLRVVDLSADSREQYDAELALPTVGHYITLDPILGSGLTLGWNTNASPRLHSLIDLIGGGLTGPATG